jgi:hypothetical protein
MTDLELDEEFNVEEEKSDHHYRTEIPNIVFKLGISIQAIALYAYLKNTAGDKSACWKKQKTICGDLDISPASYVKYRKELAKPQSLLNGKPLIKIQIRKNADKSNQTTKIFISGIWRDNGDFFRAQPHSKYERPPIQNMNDPIQNMNGEQEPLEEEPLKTNKPEAPASALPPSSESVRSFRDELLNKTELTAPQAMKIKTQFANLDDDTFKEAMEAFFVYAKEKPIGNLVATIVTALGGGKDGKPWKKTKGKSDLAIENKKRIHEVFGKYDYKSIKGIIECNVNILRDYIEFTCGGKGYLFQYKQVDFKEAINKFLKKAQIQITI